MAKRKQSKKKHFDTSLPIYDLKITLQEIEPPIWRRVQVDDCSLEDLHCVIQEAMGWEDEHHFVFEVAGRTYGDAEDDDSTERPSEVRLSDLAAQGIGQFVYEYDLGDSWRHDLEIEQTRLPEAGLRYPHCVAGARACPPEDCGGPWGYDSLLEKLRNPPDDDEEDGEDDELLAWLGEGFDPDAFAIEEANGRLQRLRRWLGRQRGRHAASPSFAKWQVVRVKPGIAHREYADLPLGGWTGHIIGVGWLTPISYEVRWTPETLELAHPVYGKRCARDRIDAAVYWLDEGEIEAAPPEEPLALEPPANLVLRPLSEDDPEDRIRAVFGLTSDDPLPSASEDAQRVFFAHLARRLVFPFAADLWDAIGDVGTHRRVEVLGLADERIDIEEGIVCDARDGERACRIPLAEVHAAEDDANCPHIEDYQYWHWWTLDQEEDDDDSEDELSDDLDDEDEIDDDEEGDDEDDLGDEDEFPIGTVALYGPDDKTTTKIAAGVMRYEGAEPIIKRWMASNVMRNAKVQRELEAFFLKYGVSQVAMSEGNLGCPHEEGQDFPVGEDCPFCPWWKGKQGRRARD